MHIAEGVTKLLRVTKFEDFQCYKIRWDF